MHKRTGKSSYGPVLLFLAGLAFLTLGLVLQSSSCTDDALTCVDHQACFDLGGGRVRVLNEGEALEGECRTGLLDCATGKCRGSVGPVPEECNSRDDDCNGVIDDGVFAYTTPCDVGVCGVCAVEGFPVCRNGQVVCDSAPEPEICNALDDDCDCETDEIPVQFDYSGPVETLGVGECAPRVIACVNGATRVVPEILPVEEVCGDGKDNDCDGQVDEPALDVDPLAIVLALDYSGSMTSEYKLQLVLEQVCQASMIAPDAFTMAIVGFGLEVGMALFSDFVPAPDACQVLLDLQGTSAILGGAIELQPDAVMHALNSTEWPSSSRLLLMATDEALQEDIYTLDDLSTACQDETFEVLAVTVPEHDDPWLELVTDCGGELVYFYTFNAGQLIFDSIAAPRCQ